MMMMEMMKPPTNSVHDQKFVFHFISLIVLFANKYTYMEKQKLSQPSPFSILNSC